MNTTTEYLGGPTGPSLEPLYEKIAARIGPDGRKLILELDGLYGERMCAVEDQAMRKVGMLCLEHGQRDLWAAIYRAVHSELCISANPNGHFGTERSWSR